MIRFAGTREVERDYDFRNQQLKLSYLSNLPSNRFMTHGPVEEITCERFAAIVKLAYLL